MEHEIEREAFEAAHEALLVSMGHPFAPAVFTRNEDGDYVNGIVEWSWLSWEAAIASIVVTLPVGPKTLPTGDPVAVERCNVIHNTVRACRNAVLAAGLKVVPGVELKP